MQKRHTDRKMYFRDLEITSKEFYISYLSDFTELTSKSRILEVGCGEGGNLVPFAQLGCKVTGIDVAECRFFILVLKTYHHLNESYGQAYLQSKPQSPTLIVLKTS